MKINNANKMQVTDTDALKFRMMRVKSQIPFDYTTIYQYEFGMLNEKEIFRVRAVWNLRSVDELIISRFETIAENLKNYGAVKENTKAA